MERPPARPLGDENARLEALRSCALLDTPAEADFDDLIRLAAQTCGAPMAALGLIDADREWFKARLGLDAEAMPRDQSLGALAILHADIFVVPDALADPALAANPLVAAPPHVRFYAAAPLVTPQGHALGVLCVMDLVPRDLNDTQREGLRALGRQALAQLETRRHVIDLGRAVAEASRAEELLRRAVASPGPRPPADAETGRRPRYLLAVAAGIVPMGLTLWGFLSGDPVWVLTSGLVASGFIAAAVLFLTSTEKRALALADRTTSALRESEGRVSAVVDNVADGILTYAEGGAIESYNRAAEHIFGYPPSMALGQRIDFLVPDSPENLLSGLHGEAEGRRVDGTNFPMELSISEMRREDRRTFIAVVRDITERRRAERRLDVQHVATRALAESPSLEDALPKLLAATGRALDWDFGTFWSVEHQTNVLRAITTWTASEVLAEFQAVTREVTLAPGADLPGRVWRDGTPTWVSNLALDPDFPRAAAAARAGLRVGFGAPVALGGEVIGIIEFFSRTQEPPDPELLQTVSSVGSQIAQFIERDDADKALRASDERMRSVLDNMLEGLIIVDEQGVIESANPAAERMFGYATWELVGQHLTLLLPRFLVPQADAFLKDARQKALGRVSEWQGRRKNGENFAFELSLFEFQTAEGRRLAGHFRDVSERQKLERMKKEFVATVSHELRTPLTSIRGSLSLLAGGALGELPDEARDVVAIAERNTLRLIDLINDILDLERLAAGQLKMHVAELPLAATVQRAAESVRPMADAQGIRFELQPTTAVAFADGDRVVQVLVNLLANAVKFSPRDSLVSVSCVEQTGYVEVRVQDRGRGIPASYLETIFERFQQVETSDSRQKGGSGLGLAICKTIIEQQGGKIGVWSEKGKGSTFWFRLPAAPEAPALDPAQAPGDAFLDALRGGFDDEGKTDVLLADPDDALLGVMTRQLLTQGISVRAASTYKSALALARHQAPGLLVLDDQMPEGDAASILAAMREDPALKDTPLLVYTVSEPTEEQRERLRLGPTRFLTKSKATDKEFLRLVQELLGRPATHAEPA